MAWASTTQGPFDAAPSRGYAERVVFRIPIFTVRALLDALSRRARAAARGVEQAAQGPSSRRSSSPGSELWARHSRPDDCVTNEHIEALRRHWLSQPLWRNALDVFEAKARPSQSFLRRFFSERSGSPVGGGVVFRDTFDPRLDWASVVADRHCIPPHEGFDFAPLDASLPDLEGAFGPLESYLLPHDDETFFRPISSKAGSCLEFRFSGGWQKLSDGRYRHRLRMTPDEEIVAAQDAVPEAVTYRFDTRGGST